MTIKHAGAGAVLAVLVILTGCQEPELITTAEMPVMYTRARVEIAAGEAAYLGQLISTTEDELKRLTLVFDAEDPASEISKINQLEVKHRLPISSEMYRFLSFAYSYNEKTNGAFDLSTRKLRRMWGFDGGPSPGPISPEIAKAGIQTLGMDSIKLTKNLIQINSPYVELTLRDMLDGYMTDLCIIRMRNVFRNFKISIGESARAWGIPGEGAQWTYDVPHPTARDKHIGTIHMAGNVGVASSRLYQETQRVDGKTIGHIIDPRSGMPVDHTLEVVVVAPTATAARALATSLNTLGLKEGRDILGNFPRCEVLIIPRRQPMELWMTENFRSYFRKAANLEATTHTIRRLEPREEAEEQEQAVDPAATPAEPAGTEESGPTNSVPTTADGAPAPGG